MFTPASILGIWFRGFLSIFLVGAGIGLLTYWYNHRETYVIEHVAVTADPQVRPNDPPTVFDSPTQTVERTRTVPWQFGFNWITACLIGGILCLAWSVGGGWLCNPRLLRPKGEDEPKELKGEIRKLRQPDGSELHVDLYGPADAPVMVCIHGWGLDHQEWYYFKKEFGRDHRIITWDLPGLGKSDRPADRDWNLEKLARRLESVVALAGNKPVVLVGHSIGAMIILTYCKLFQANLGSRISRLVLAQSTYTNPVKTMSFAWLYTLLQKPVLEPLCHLMVWFSPLVRVLNWMSVWNGSAHRSTERESFAGTETRGQLDFITSYTAIAPPDVIARGMLAMFQYDATETLGRIHIPTLVVTGKQDSACLPEAGVHMAASIPGAELVVLAPARHCGLFEQHEQFHAAVRRFLPATTVPERATTATQPASV